MNIQTTTRWIKHRRGQQVVEIDQHGGHQNHTGTFPVIRKKNPSQYPRNHQVPPIVAQMTPGDEIRRHAQDDQSTENSSFGSTSHCKFMLLSRLSVTIWTYSSGGHQLNIELYPGPNISKTSAPVIFVVGLAKRYPGGCSSTKISRPSSN